MAITSPHFAPTNFGLLKQINTARLLELLRCHAPISRAELARLTGLTRSTVTIITSGTVGAGRGDAHAVVQDWAENLGRGLISVVSLLNPEQIVLGDPLTVLFPYIKDSLVARLRDKMPRQGEQGFFSNPNAIALVT